MSNRPAPALLGVQPVDAHAVAEARHENIQTRKFRGKRVKEHVNTHVRLGIQLSFEKDIVIHESAEFGNRRFQLLLIIDVAVEYRAKVRMSSRAAAVS